MYKQIMLNLHRANLYQSYMENNKLINNKIIFQLAYRLFMLHLLVDF